MIHTRSRRALSAIVLVATIGLMGAACTTPAPYGGPPKANYQFKTTSAKVIQSQDAIRVFGVCVSLTGCSDEVYTLNIAFTVGLGDANSAQTFVVQGDSTSSIGEGSTHIMSGNEQATTQFSNLNTVGLVDLANGAKLQIAGIWSWAMDADLFAANSAGTVANILKSALNSTVAGTALPTNPDGSVNAGGIVSSILGAIGVGGAFSLLGSTLAGVTGLSDDAVGSRMYIGIGINPGDSLLSGIIDSTVGAAAFPSLAIPVVSIPPDIQGGRIFRLGGPTSSWVDNFDQPGDGNYDMGFAVSSF